MFDGPVPNMAAVMMLTFEELHLWGLARARAISNLLALAAEGCYFVV